MYAQMKDLVGVNWWTKKLWSKIKFFIKWDASSPRSPPPLLCPCMYNEETVKTEWEWSCLNFGKTLSKCRQLVKNKIGLFFHGIKTKFYDMTKGQHSVILSLCTGCDGL